MHVVTIELIISRSLLDEAAFDSAAHIARESARAAMAHMDDDGTRYAYRYLDPRTHDYNPGPFDYRRTPGDLPPGAALIIGRVAVEKVEAVA